MSKLENFFSKNWKPVLVLTGVFIVCNYSFIGKSLDRGSASEFLAGVLGVSFAGFIVAVILMIFVRIVESAFRKM